MTSISTQRSAMIYQFPVGGRAGLIAPYDQSSQTKSPASGEFVLVDAWYHQDAIRESQQVTKQ